MNSPAGRLSEAVAATGQVEPAVAAAAALGVPAYAELGLLGLDRAAAS